MPRQRAFYRTSIANPIMRDMTRPPDRCVTKTTRSRPEECHVFGLVSMAFLDLLVSLLTLTSHTRVDVLAGRTVMAIIVSVGSGNRFDTQAAPSVQKRFGTSTPDCID